MAESSVATDSDTRTLVIERDLPAAPDRVFAAWTDPSLLVKWWGPEGMTTPECAMDVRPGGAYRTTMAAPNGDRHTVSGVYKTIEPPRLLVFTWAWDQEDGSRGHETVVEIVLEPIAKGTRMRLTQRLFADGDQRDRHNMGWSSSFNDLERLLA